MKGHGRPASSRYLSSSFLEKCKIIVPYKLQAFAPEGKRL
jgi:hypothetical protein